MTGDLQGKRKMQDVIYEKVKKYIADHGMIMPGECVVAGVSGGADSVSMLHLLCRLQKEISFQLSVVHIDHGLRAEAGEDATFVEKLCVQWGLPFFLRKVDMPGYAAQYKVSLEEAGRILRYQAFDQILREIKGDNVGKIAVAHNAEDRAETMLFHMFRGSGLKGLGSIRPIRESVIRPLLTVSRAEIEAYLDTCSLVYREDATNGEDTYARNRIRHHILPYAQQEICCGAVSHMGELADILAETEDYLERETRRLYGRYVEETVESALVFEQEPSVTELAINLEGLASEDGVMIKRILLYALERITPHRKDIGACHIRGLLELMEKAGSKELFLPNGVRACKEYQILLLKRTEHDKENVSSEGGIVTIPEILLPDIPVDVNVPGTDGFTFILWEADSLREMSLFYRKEQNIPENRYTKWFDYDKITTSLLLRTRREGDYLTIDDALHTQSVKRYMVNEKIPKMKRSSMYMLADGSHILWIPGYRISTHYKVGESTKRILEVRIRGGNDGGTNRGIVVGGRG